MEGFHIYSFFLCFFGEKETFLKVLKNECCARAKRQTPKLSFVKDSTSSGCQFDAQRSFQMQTPFRLAAGSYYNCNGRRHGNTARNIHEVRTFFQGQVGAST